MTKRKFIRLSKEQKSLLIALLIGDGTISSNYVFKLSHSTLQREYLEWKVNLLNTYGIKNNGVKEYISKCGYNTGREVLYSQMSLIPTIKALRRSIYVPKKTITRKLLEWLNPLGLAIWYMDDGCINVNTSKQRSSIQHTIKIATCADEATIKTIISYFDEVWDIHFRPFKEGRSTYSIVSSSELDCEKFIKIVKPYIEQVPSFLYKIRKDFTKEEFIKLQESGSEVRDIIF